MPDRGFKINHAAIRQMSREIEQEFAKHPIRVPIEVEGAEAVTYNQPEQDELALLTALHRSGAVGLSSTVHPSELALDLSAERIEAAIELALADRYIKMPTFAGKVHLTQSGRTRTQRASAPARSSSVVHNDFSGATITGSNIATGDNSTQSNSTVAVDVALLRQIRGEALALIDRDVLGVDVLDDLDADLEVIDAQLADPTVRKKGLKRALQSLEQIAINAAGGAGGTGLAALISQLL